VHAGSRDPFDLPPGSLADVLWLAARLPEYRSLLYYRARHHGIVGKIAARLAAIFYPGAPGLLIGNGEIGPGLYIEHGYSSVLAAERIGRDCWINQNVTLASNRVKGACTLGDRVYIRPGVVVLGGTHVGDDTEVGANSVVTRDLPPGKVAVGAPARVIRENQRTRL
jgi:serine O-acetyltransferase